MLCKTCGRNSLNESANFCEYCGTSFRGNEAMVQEDFYSRFKEQHINDIEKDKLEKPISFKNWFGTMLIPLIPFVGIFIFIVMMFVWACSNDTPESKRNWARASLLIALIFIVLIVFMISSVFTEMMNSGLNMEDYMKQFYKNY